MGRVASFWASVPERLIRSLVAGVGGAVHETAEVVLPRFARRSRLYEATAKNLLRIAIELVGVPEAPSSGRRGRSAPWRAFAAELLTPLLRFRSTFSA